MSTVSPNVETMVVQSLFLKDFDVRARMFEALRTNPDSELFCVETDDEKWIINLKDPVICRGIFIWRQAPDFDKLLTALDLLKQHNQFPDSMLDVGANIGAICIAAVARGVMKRAVAIEPHPLNCALLRTNAALNNVHQKIRIIEAAAGAVDGETVELTHCTDNYGDHRVLCSGVADTSLASRDKIPVPVAQLDAQTDVDGSMIWMDIQGYEGYALMGAKRLLSAKPPLVLEFWPLGMQLAESFDILQDAIAHYQGFYDLDKPTGLRPLSELPALYAELEATQKGSFTDILVV